MARFMEIKSVNPKFRQDQIAKELSWSGSTLQRYRQNINMLSPYRIPPNSNKRKQKISSRENDHERPQLTSKESSLETVKPMRKKTKGYFRLL